MWLRVNRRRFTKNYYIEEDFYFLPYDALLKEVKMSKSLRLACTLATLLGAAPLITACHTTAGVGQDLSQGGHALTNSANKNAPTSPSP
jgi:predicted small secreted protein